MKPLPELRRCPWCRGKALALEYFGDWFVWCSRPRCHATGPERKTARVAIKAWNAPADFAREP